MPRQSSASPVLERSVESSATSPSTGQNTGVSPEEVIEDIPLTDSAPDAQSVATPDNVLEWPVQASTLPQRVLDELARDLDHAFVKKLPTGMDYIPSHYAIQEANKIFGFGGWSSRVVKREIWPIGSDFVAIAEVEVSVVLANGDLVSFTDVGTIGFPGTNRNGQANTQGAETAIMGAASTAEKRALRHFGDRFGLGLYDKDNQQNNGQYNGNGANGYQSPARPAAPQQQAPQSANPGSQYACTEPGCTGTMQGFTGNDGKVVTADAMAASSQRRFNRILCNDHYRKALRGG